MRLTRHLRVTLLSSLALVAGVLGGTAVAADAATPQTVTFTNLPPDPVVGATYTPVVAATSGGPVTLSIDPPSGAVCSIAAGVVSFIHPGFCVILADQAGDATYDPGSAMQSVLVAKAATTTVLTFVTIHFGTGYLNARVSVDAPGAAPISGNVEFRAAGVVIGTEPVSDAGVAFLGYDPPVGPMTQFQATYIGNADLGSSSGSVTKPAVVNPTLEARPTGAPTAAGWYAGPVQVLFVCTPGSAPLTLLVDLPLGYPEPVCPAAVTLSVEGAAQTVTRTIYGDDGGRATTTSPPVNIDLTKPVVAVTGVVNGKTYRIKNRKKAPKASCTGTDALSGLLSPCTVTIVSKDTKGRKSKITLEASATDIAGNVSTQRVTYKTKIKKKKRR